MAADELSAAERDARVRRAATAEARGYGCAGAKLAEAVAYIVAERGAGREPDENVLRKLAGLPPKVTPKDVRTSIRLARRPQHRWDRIGARRGAHRSRAPQSRRNNSAGTTRTRPNGTRGDPARLGDDDSEEDELTAGLRAVVRFQAHVDRRSPARLRPMRFAYGGSE